jgi:HAD superfamily hydrolase (TIGR01458 family)
MTSTTGFDAVFFDLSGVLYEGESVVPGAVDAVRRARQAGLVLRFLTNTSRKSSVRVAAQLQSMGFEFSSEEVITAPAAVRNWLLERGLRPWCLVHRDIQEEFSDLQTDEPDAVVIADAAEDFSYANLNRAFQLCQAGATLVGIGMNRYFRQGGELMLDAGPFIRAIEFASGQQAFIVGKPAPAFYQAAVAHAAVNPARVLMVGDDVEADVQGAIASGLQACLVRTGKYRPGDEGPTGQDFHCVASVVEAVDLALA